MTSQHPKESQEPLLFIDTNIFLDFYRARNDAGISLLSKIDKLHARIITTCQVEMEFKKNRQKVISESFSGIKPPDTPLATPAFLLHAQTVKLIATRMEDVRKRIKGLKSRIISTLQNPKTHDRIYQTTQRLFGNTTPLNLKRDSLYYQQVWRKALRRFLEGKPPRKTDDTSAGDAINWEWIVHCIQQTNRDVIIVSRDADYGLTIDGKGYANNWLTEEIKNRVNQQRNLVLVDRLSVALKLIDVKVTPAEVTSERAILKSRPSPPPQDYEFPDPEDYEPQEPLEPPDPEDYEPQEPPEPPDPEDYEPQEPPEPPEPPDPEDYEPSEPPEPPDPEDHEPPEPPEQQDPH